MWVLSKFLYFLILMFIWSTEKLYSSPKFRVGLLDFLKPYTLLKERKTKKEHSENTSCLNGEKIMLDIYADMDRVIC